MMNPLMDAPRMAIVDVALLERVPHAVFGRKAVIEIDATHHSPPRMFTVIGVIVPLGTAFDVDKLPEEIKAALEHTVLNLAAGVSVQFAEMNNQGKGQ